MTSETKERIAGWFFRYPAICMLVWTLLFSVGFRLCFLGLLLLPVILALALAKIWRTTPSGFLPVVRISGVDWLQAKALERSAQRELQSGRVSDGLIAYNLAVENNSGDQSLLRGFLRQVVRHAEPPRFQGPALWRAFWLMRLTQTNVIDLELASAVFEKYGLEDYLIALLKCHEDRLTLPLQKIFLRALFNQGHMAEFDAFWRERAATAALPADPEMRLYRAAFREGWGLCVVPSPLRERVKALDESAALEIASASPSPQASPAGRERTATENSEEPQMEVRLNDHLHDPQWRVLAHRLRLRVCEQRDEVDEYLACLERLSDWKLDRLIDHVRAWRLLAGNQRRDSAIERARALAMSPATGLETFQLAQAYLALGLRELAQRLLDRFTLEFSFLDELWILYANLLIESEQWDNLRRLALQIGLDSTLSERLGDLSHFLEGRVELAQHRLNAARQAFGRIGTSRCPHPQLTLAMAPHLWRWGHREKALSLLKSVERFSEHNPVYWDTLATLAFELKDAELLLKSTAKALALNPADRVARNNYAAALLINRRQPEQAIQHTFALWSHRPDAVAFRINHALALIQNYRYEDADRLLAQIDPQRLSASERALYNFGCVEVLVRQGRLELARTFSREVEADHLFPEQGKHLQELRETFESVIVRKSSVDHDEAAAATPPID